MDLFSESYRQQQQDLHDSRPDYGVASVQFAPMVSELINGNNVKELLDYGAGKGRLAQSIQINHEVQIQMYDPGVPQFSKAPAPKEMVCCIDVLEHIEPEYLDNVLDHLQLLTQRMGFFTVHTGPAAKVLPDGRNAHLIQQPSQWWLPKILSRFELHQFLKLSNGFFVVVLPLTQPKN